MGIRFAPSPTGKFHIGNLRTAWISWWIAKQFGKPWICRFEDIDGPRVLAGAMEDQLADLKLLGMIPDQILIQSTFHSRHVELFRKAVESRQVYPCFCSRKEVLDALHTAASAPHGEPSVYHGKCRNLMGFPEVVHPTVAWRFRGESADGNQDFIIGRTDLPREWLKDGRKVQSFTDSTLDSFLPAYHWACAIDDYDGEYSLLVRAWDLSSVVPLQRAIHAWMGHENTINEVPRPPSAVFHTSLVVGEAGERLEKRSRGVTLVEMMEKGISPKTILEKFRLSFSTIPDLSPEAIGGEEKKQLILTEIFG